MITYVNEEVRIVIYDGVEISVTVKEMFDMYSSRKGHFSHYWTYKDGYHMYDIERVPTFENNGVVIKRCDGGKLNIDDKELCYLADNDYFPAVALNLEGIITYRSVDYDYKCK